jgi:hypothetical protein
MWHRDNNAGYEEKTIAVPFAAIGEFSAWGSGLFYNHCQETVQTMVREARPQVETEWVAAEKEKIKDVKVTLSKVRAFDGQFGRTSIYTFVEGKHIYVWFTTKSLIFNVGDKVILSGTVKKLQEYEGEKQTVLTRCTVVANNEVE